MSALGMRSNKTRSTWTRENQKRLTSTRVLQTKHTKKGEHRHMLYGQEPIKKRSKKGYKCEYEQSKR